MTSAFFDAFPNIVPEEEVLRDLLLHVTVTRVTMDSNRTLLRIYISSDRLIQKKDIDRIEELIRDQVIGERDMDAKVIETFKLSGQYRAKSLMRVYRPSILHELRGYQMFLYNMFREADISFTDDDTCVLTVADTLVSHRLEKELRRVLEKIFTQRCGLDLKLTIAYEKHEDASDPAAALRSRLDAAGAEGDGTGSRMGAAAEAGTGAAAEGAAEENREGTVRLRRDSRRRGYGDLQLHNLHGGHR